MNAGKCSLHTQIIVCNLGDVNTTICTMVDIRCYVGANDAFARNLMVNDCNCLPDCTTITYDVEISQAQMFELADVDALKESLNGSG